MTIQDSIQSLANTLRNTSVSAKSTLGASLESLRSSLPSTASSFTPQNLTQNAALGSTKVDVEAAKKVAEDNYQKLAQSLAGTSKAGAIQPPTSFVTSPSGQAVQTVTLETTSTSFNLDSLTAAETTKLSNLIGASNLSTDEIALQALQGKLNTTQIAAPGKTASMVSTMKSSNSGLFSGMISSISETTDVDIASWPSKAKEYLPTDLQRAVGSISSRTTDQLAGKLSTLNRSLSAISDVGSQLSSVLGLGGSYDELTGANGQALYGVAGKDMSYSQVNALYKDAQAICSNVDLLSLLEYGNLKDVFDVLVNAALNGGLAQLLKQLMNCGTFADKRTGYIMQSNTYTVASRGDIYTLNAIQEYVGASGMTSPLSTARIVAANMDYNDSTQAELDTFLTANGLTRQDLVKDSSSKYSAISTQNVGFLSSKSSGLTTGILGSDLTTTALQFLSTFG